MNRTIEPGWLHQYVGSPGGATLHTVTAGPAHGPPIILLHGFPEFWWGWRHQIEPLARAGFRVIVPDMRGYGASDAPIGVLSYRLDILVDDILSIADTNEAPRFHLVGHDWGGIVAWAVAAKHPQRIERVSILNAPHLDVMARVLRRHPAQVLRSSYIGFFQLDGLAEAVLRARGFALLKRMMRGTGLNTTFSDAELATYAAAWACPGRLTAMLNYYRALIRRPRAPLGTVEPRLQILWGMQDRALGFALAEASLSQCRQGSLIRFPDASHWLQHDEASTVAAALIAFHAAL